MTRYKHLFAYIPILLIAAVMLALYLSGLYHDLNFQEIKAKHADLQLAVHAHPYLSVFYFILIYIVSVCLIIPDSTFLSLIAGFLFPWPLATLYIVFSETLGALIFFLAARLAFSATTFEKTSPLLHKIQNRVKRHQIAYSLFFRFSHLLPFWMINLGSAVLKIRTRVFFWTTLIGILPFSIVFAQGGRELSRYFDKAEVFSIGAIFTPEVKVTLLCLGLLSLLPILIGKLFHKRLHPK